jgi:type IV pilus assembly protein PilM
MIDRLLEAVRRAGLSPQAIDLSAFAMVRALHRPGGTGATLYVSIAGVTNLAVAEGTTCLFTRVLARGAESMAEELAERRGLNLEHAVGWLRHTGLLAPLDDIEDSGKPEIVAEARAILLDASQRIADDMRNTLSFYEMQAGSPPVERIVLSGAAAAIPGFSDRLGAALGLPWEQVTVREGRPGAFGGVEPARLTIAAGLSVEEVIA